MRSKNVIVLPYDPKWKTDFEKIKRELVKAIGYLTLCIEHVGSTSVEGLSAKPIIDIDVVISDYSVFDKVVSRFETIGYVHEGNLGIEKLSNTPTNHIYKHTIYMYALRIQESCCVISHSEIFLEAILMRLNDIARLRKKPPNFFLII